MVPPTHFDTHNHYHNHYHNRRHVMMQATLDRCDTLVEGEVENESEARSGSEYDSESDYSYQDQDEEYEESRDAMDIDDDSAESEDDLEHDLRRLSVLEMDDEEFDEFCSSLDPYRWRKRPSETALTDYWNPYWH